MDQSKLLDWPGHTAVVLASGPSITHAQTEMVRESGAKTITTNTTWQLAPWADVHYACDLMWWKTNYAALVSKDAIRKCWTQDRTSAERYGLRWVRQSARPGLGLKEVQVNGNSGFGAINLAFLFGCRRILLLGFDMKPGAQGRLHWHPDHPAPMVQKQQFGEWIHKGTLFARELKDAGCSVVNCTPGSALTCFKTAELQGALAP
jgi:hypothetical protein